ncbi:MAG: hypothetical protein R2880_15315 [Deinococcales bacterium]
MKALGFVYLLINVSKRFAPDDLAMQEKLSQRLLAAYNFSPDMLLSLPTALNTSQDALCVLASCDLNLEALALNYQLNLAI